MKCLVLGGEGFMGSHLVDALLAQGHTVRCFDRPRLHGVSVAHAGDPAFERFEGDFTSQIDVAHAMDGMEVCYHLISTTLPKHSNDDPIFDVQSNLVGTLSLLNQAVRQKMRKVIFVSSGGTVYGTPRQIPVSEEHPTAPICSYGITKLAIEKYLALYHHLHGLDYTVLRLANPYGERQRVQASQGVVAVFLDKVMRGEPIDIWGDGSVVRDFVYVGDVVRAMVLALERTTSDKVFNIGSGSGKSLNDVLSAIERVCQKDAKPRYLQSRSFDVAVNVLDISRAGQQLGWHPQVEFEEGVRRFANWLSAAA